MSKINLKDNIFIEGFDSQYNLDEYRYMITNDIDNTKFKYIYEGKTSEISEELAKECVKSLNSGYIDYEYPNQYPKADYTNEFSFKTAKESFQSACKREYCVIYRLD